MESIICSRFNRHGRCHVSRELCACTTYKLHFSSHTIRWLFAIDCSIEAGSNQIWMTCRGAVCKTKILKLWYRNIVVVVFREGRGEGRLLVLRLAKAFHKKRSSIRTRGKYSKREAEGDRENEWKEAGILFTVYLSSRSRNPCEPRVLDDDRRCNDYPRA